VLECTDTCNDVLYLGTVDPGTATTSWESQVSVDKLKRSIDNIRYQENMGYCLIRCGSSMHGHDQILNLPPVFSEKPNVQNSNPVNLNIIFLDSVSRQHFFRVLPQTAKALDAFKSDKRHKNTLILDYELVQGIKSRTYETVMMFFGGKVDLHNKDVFEKIPIAEVFGPLHDIGYHTMWVEDLCPNWAAGLNFELRVYDEALSDLEMWKRFRRELPKARIDQFGNTYLSCNVFSSYDVNDHFSDLHEKVCYNGKHHHDYHVDYFTMYQKQLQKKSRPFVTYMMNSLSHEGTGKRISNLDVSLAKYMEYARELKSTITILYSDHGNSYSQYKKRTSHGRVEAYHPFFFLILPEDVQHLFNQREIDALIVNQKRLISLLDGYYTLQQLLHKISPAHIPADVLDYNKQFNVTKYGLFETISPARSCSNMPRAMPNLCICEGYEVTSVNYAYHYVLAQYFVGMLNNELLNQRAKGDKSGSSIGGFGNCYRLRVETLKNVQVSQNKVS